MRGLLIQTDREPVVIDIQRDEGGSTLHSLQNLVGGNIEAFSPLFGEGIDLYVNEDGLTACPPNRAIYATKEMEEEGYLSQMDYAHVAKEGELYTILHGDIVAIGFDPETGDSRGLTSDEMDEVNRYFTDVSKPGSGLTEVLGILRGAHRNSHSQEEHLSLKDMAQDAKDAADHLEGERSQNGPEHGKDER